MKIYYALIVAVVIFCANIFSADAVPYEEQVQQPVESTQQPVEQIQQPIEVDPYERSVADLLAQTKAAQKTNQILLVVGNRHPSKFNAEFSTWQRTPEGWWARVQLAQCGIGRNGLNANRHAGDKTTPIGSFKILYAFGKAPNPGTQMLYRNITPNSYLSSEYDTYNTWVESFRPMSGEHLTDYYQYKYGMDIGFNQNPIVYGKGAAIFLHCKSYDRWWTSGCVSLEEKDMVEVLQFTQNGAYMIIVPAIEDIARY